ncbi:hypothetical protein J3456_19180 [Sulfitobacter sp. NFXS29]|uniref:hypothetical protein n=1 Tax=Sulfitobacter sp. NFXS29 TaxID=2818438 RepID=UPI0032DFC49C
MSEENLSLASLPTIIAIAFTQSRETAHVLRQIVIPTLPPVKRTFPDRLIRRIEVGHIFNETLIQDLEVLAALIDSMIAKGTHFGWQADEHHVRGGYEVTFVEDDALDLASARREVDALTSAIARTLDAVRAGRVAEELQS